MTTARDIIRRAHSKIGVIGAGEPLPAQDLVDGLNALNSMLHGFKLRNVDLSHSDMAAGDLIPIGSEFDEGLVYLLAARLASDFEVPQTFDADDWMRQFQAAYAVPSEVTLEAPLTQMPSQRFYRYTTQ